MRSRGRALLIVGLAALAVGYASDTLLFEAPEKLRRSGAEGIRRRLAADGVQAVWTFDDPEVIETLSGGVGVNYGSALEGARFGRGRRFAGKPGERISTPIPWSRLGSSYTISLWVKIFAPAKDQALISPGGGTGTGLRLIDGQVVFTVPAAGNPVAAYRFARFGEFVHLAAVVDAAAGEARLYEDGVFKASGAISAVARPEAAVEFGAAEAIRVRVPLQATFDEAVLWSRVLSPKEVRRLARAFWPFDFAIWRRAPGWALLRWIGEGLTTLAAGARAVADAFNVSLHDRSAETVPGVPALELVLSNKDQREFEGWFRKCLRQGRELDPETAERGIQVISGGGLIAARLLPYGPSPAYWEHPKHSFILEVETPLPGFGDDARRLLLVPPETRGLLQGLFSAALARRYRLPHRPVVLVALRINGFSKGFYLCEDWSPPGAGERLQAPVFPDPVGRIPLPPEELLAEYDQLRARYEPLLRGDRRTPLTARRLAWQVRRDRRRLADAAAALQGRTGQQRADLTAAWLREEIFLGGNPARAYLLRDLDLEGPQLPGVRLTWRSLNPELLDDRGHLRRPVEGPPVEVGLEAAVSIDGASATRLLRFTVVPLSHRLPVLSLAAADQINNGALVPCRAAYYDGQGRLLAGALAGGLKFRGNSALKRPKMSYSLHLRERGAFFPGSAGRVSYLMSCYTDPSYLNDRLSYDLFREFGAAGGTRPAVRIHHVVVFINGEYQGLYQISERVDRHLLGFPRFNPKDVDHGLIFKAQDAAANFARPDLGAYIQIEPDREEGDFFDALGGFITFVGSADPEAFSTGIGRRLDLDNFLDYFILTNASRNMEGVNYNFYLACAPGADQRFFFVPWDFDKAYRRSPNGWLQNNLSQRLLTELPGFRETLARRWRELRSGALADAALDARIETAAAELAGSAEVDRNRWDPEGPSFRQGVDELQRWLHARLAMLDGTLYELTGTGN